MMPVVGFPMPPILSKPPIPVLSNGLPMPAMPPLPNGFKMPNGMPMFPPPPPFAIPAFGGQYRPPPGRD